MIYTIENEKLKVAISDLGAELQSVKGKKSGFEYLWQGDPEFWKNRATVCFPICGRLFEGKYTYEGKEYEMILHGIAKISTFSVFEQKQDKLTLELKSNDETKKSYPFDFIFRVTFSLDGDKLTTAFKVINQSEKDLPFSIGGHPGFNLPLEDGLKFEDYYIQFGKDTDTKIIEVSPTVFYTGKNIPFETKNGRFNLKHNLFDNDAIFFCDMDNKVTLKSDKGTRSVTLIASDATHIGFWHKPFTEAPYVCIEPWHGIPSYDGKVDDFATKNEFIHLGKGKEYDSCFDIVIKE